MSAIFMVFGLIVVLSCVTFLSRSNVNRFLRQRKAMAVLMLLRSVTDK